ncbi:MAG: tRNA (uridine(34)/cytosine(34)/5-carboxymethylaminomethyluridine(34)-2'-O)-methyltransferase TrmL [Deltaproteobacteria bacterium]|nr:tRNA (uridine(34)/cytosine(34)/5-carboxymethylaminomethyluridine(34)-2'-O)-methyltransferase TrmL [Deltaproteobacteria bacterium]
MNIVLVEPQIPQNTGNIARLCAATGTPLHLVGKLGFRTDDKSLRRAGLDYWKLLDISYHNNFEDFEKKPLHGNYYFLSTKGGKNYSEISYRKGDYLIFGSETKGLPSNIMERFKGSTMRIPMIREARSLNLSSSVSIVLYEALRQNAFINYQPCL